MRMRFTPLLTTVAVFALSFATPAAAATDGALGSTSTGIVNVSLTTAPSPPPVLVIGLPAALTFPSVVVGNSATVSPFCLVIPSPAATYTLTVTTGNETAGAAYLAGPNNTRLSYVISFADVAMVQTSTSLNPVGRGPIPNLVPSRNANCDGGEVSRLGISVVLTPSTAPGVYTDVITLTITPS